MANIGKREIRRIEASAALRNIRGVLESAPQGDDLDYDEFDDIGAYLKLLRWRKGTRGECLTHLLKQIVEAFASANGGAAFHPSSVLALVECMEGRFKKDIDLSGPKKRKKK